MKYLTDEQLERIKQVFDVIDEVTDELEEERPFRTDCNELYKAWSILDDVLEEHGSNDS